jgi:glycerophosphoryl diester phosphodiesterase
MTLLLGHRGARVEKNIPENTLASFDLALAHGCDGFEFDVRLTADGQAVICHDATIGRRKIAESPAQALNLPTLREVLTRYQGAAFLDVELKVAGLEQITVDLLRELAPARGVVVSSFLPEVLRAIHALDASLPLGLICETREELGRWPGLPVEYVIPNHKLLRKNVLSQLKAAGKKILVWTVNLPVDMRGLAKAGVDGIISDDPGLLVLTLRGKTSR